MFKEFMNVNKVIINKRYIISCNKGVDYGYLGRNVFKS